MSRFKLLLLAIAVVTIMVGGPLMNAQEGTEDTAGEDTTPADIGITDDGTAPMTLTGPSGESLADEFQVVDDGYNEKFRISEDADDVSVTEHSVIYNQDAMGAAGMNPGQPDIQWTLTNNDTGEVQDAGSGGTEYSGVITTPGYYQLGNDGMTPTGEEGADEFGGFGQPDEEEDDEADLDVYGDQGATGDGDGDNADLDVWGDQGATGDGDGDNADLDVWGGQGVTSGTDVELEVTDSTAPDLKVVLTPEDSFVDSVVYAEEDPDAPNGYPVPEKKARLTVSGKNWTPAAVEPDDADDIESAFAAPGGMLDPDREAELLPIVDDSKVNPDIKSFNDYTIDEELNEELVAGVGTGSQLEDGFYIPVSVRCRFACEVVDDNDPRQSYRDKIMTRWNVVVRNPDGTEEKFRDAPSFIFRKANWPPQDGDPYYELAAQAVDGSGNSVTVHVPINVIRQGIDAKKLQDTSEKR